MKEQSISYETAILAHDSGFKYPVINNCPQSVLQKWLRDERGIIVWVRPGLDLKVFSWYLDGEEIPNRLNKNNYKSFEEALEAGLKEALTLLK